VQKAIFSIGANNESGMLERDAAESVLASFFDGFSAYEITGFWKGQRERTLRVEVVTDATQERLQACARKLCAVLRQDAVMLETVSANVQFVS